MACRCTVCVRTLTSGLILDGVNKIGIIMITLNLPGGSVRMRHNPGRFQEWRAGYWMIFTFFYVCLLLKQLEMAQDSRVSPLLPEFIMNPL